MEKNSLVNALMTQLIGTREKYETLNKLREVVYGESYYDSVQMVTLILENEKTE